VPTLPPDATQRDATGRFDRARHPHSLKPDQTAKLFKRFANKYGEPAPRRQILDIVKARTSNHTLPLAARSNVYNTDGEFHGTVIAETDAAQGTAYLTSVDFEARRDMSDLRYAD
jgi:hypothetical protein